MKWNTFLQTSVEKQTTPDKLALVVLEMLPSVNCVKPKDALRLMAPDADTPNDQIVMDRDEFESESFQRVYQYLSRHMMGTNLDRYSYTKENIEGTPHDCLQTLIK